MQSKTIWIEIKKIEIDKKSPAMPGVRNFKKNYKIPQPPIRNYAQPLTNSNCF